MLADFYGKDTDPGRMNAWLSTNGGYTTNGSIYWNKPAEYTGGRMTYESSLSWTSVGIGTDNDHWSSLKAQLDSGYPVIIQVDSNLSTGALEEHWVLVIEFIGGDFTEPANYRIHDPWSYSGGESLSKYHDTYYDNTFFATRVFHRQHDVIETPHVSGVAPASPMAQGDRQWISILGSNFRTDSVVTLSIEGYDYVIPSERTQYQHSGQIDVFVGLTDPGTWYARVTNPGNRVSNSFSFTVSSFLAYGIDVSHHQDIINWPGVKASGRTFAFVKASEGIGWSDELFRTNVLAATAEGIFVGPYHYALPHLNSPVSEAQWFLQVAGEFITRGFLPPALDLEEGQTMGREALSSWVHQFMGTVQSATGVTPFLYVSPAFASDYLDSSVSSYPLWVAHWTTAPSPNISWWDDWSFWQYAVGPAGIVPGISTEIDLDLFNGTDVRAILIPSSDTTPPTVSITSPTSGQTFTSSSITVAGTASDPGDPSSGVQKVEVRLNGGAWQTASGTVNWSRSAALTSGANAIEARSRDYAGNYSMIASVSVTCTPLVDTTAPTVSISSPNSGQTFTSSSITASGTASDPGSPSSGVEKVEIRLNGGAWQTASGTVNWSRSVTLSSGANTIEARSRDNAGNYSMIASVSVTYTPPVDTTPPTVSITSPTSGQTFTSSSITVTGTASEPGSPSSGVEKVEIRLNGGAWQTAGGTVNWSRSVTLSSGANTIEARSRDNAGNYSMIASVSVSYNRPTWILIIDPPEGNGTTDPPAGTYTYDVGSPSQPITAAASSDSHFDHWEGTAVEGNPVLPNPILIPSGEADQTKTLKAVFAPGPPTPWKSPTAAGRMNNDWDNPSNAFSDDELYATFVDNSYNTLWQSYENFDFEIPPGSVVNGIAVRIKGKISWDGISKLGVQVYSASDGQWGAQHDSPISNSERYEIAKTYWGLWGLTDLFGLSWTASDFNNDSFSVRMFSGGNNNKQTWSVNHLQVKLYYSAHCDGDANRDGKVNILDLVYVRNYLNLDPTSGSGAASADVNDDGKVNILDLIYVRNRLNNACP